MSRSDEREKMIVLRHAGRSYIRKNYGSAIQWHQSPVPSSRVGLYINDKHPSEFAVAAGDDDYLEIVGDITSVEKRFAPRRVAVSYKARPEFAESLKAPLSVAEYGAMDEERRDILYEPVYREEIVPPQPFPFDVLDIDAKPRTFPEGVTVTVPDYLRRFKTTWHTLPCQFSNKALFTRLAAAARAETRGKPHFDVSVHDNIFTISVSAKVKVTGFPTALSFNVLHFSEDGRWGQRLPTIIGNNLDDLMKNVDAWIAAQVEMIRNVHTPKVCPCCARKMPKGSTVVMPAGRH